MLDRIDFALDVFDRLLCGIGWYANQRKVRRILYRRPWVVLRDMLAVSIRRARWEVAYRKSIAAVRRASASGDCMGAIAAFESIAGEMNVFASWKAESVPVFAANVGGAK